MLGTENAAIVESRPDAIRARTLRRLRWAAVIGQLTALFAAGALFGAQPPLALALPIIGALALSNLALSRMRPNAARLPDREAAAWLLGDLLQLSLLLGVTGGLTNPFSVLLLAPVTVASSVLPLRATALLTAAALAAVGCLWVCALPLPMRNGPALAPPPLLLAGSWAALSLSILFITLYSRQIAHDAGRISAALSAARLALAREHRLSALGALSAATAHQLGTPLATIKLVAGELERSCAGRPDLAEDVALLREQASRCGDILRALESRELAAEPIRSAPAFAVIEEAAAPHKSPDIAMTLRLDGRACRPDDPDQPVIRRSPELMHALRNVIQNAVEFARSEVRVTLARDPEELAIRISDDGPGFRPAVLKELGEPFVTTRARSRNRDGGHHGLGLGLFISRVLIEGMHGRLDFANAPGGGAVVTARWPRSRIEAAPARRGARQDDGPGQPPAAAACDAARP